MNNQLIISIGREYGAGGHSIARLLSEKYNLPVYDVKMLEHIAEEKNINVENLKKYDEKKKNRLFTRTINGYSSSPEDTVAEMQFEFLRDRASAGESFIVVGRCANSVLKDFDGLISIFVISDIQDKIKRMAPQLDIPENKLESYITRANRKRKAYHNYYCKEKWGDSRYYELTINTGKIGISNAADVIEKYIDFCISK